MNDKKSVTINPTLLAMQKHKSNIEIEVTKVVNFAQSNVVAVRFIPPRIVVEWATHYSDDDTGEQITIEDVYTKEIAFGDVELTMDELKLGHSWQQLELNQPLHVQMELKF